MCKKKKITEMIKSGQMYTVHVCIKKQLLFSSVSVSIKSICTESCKATPVTFLIVIQKKQTNRKARSFVHCGSVGLERTNLSSKSVREDENPSALIPEHHSVC